MVMFLLWLAIASSNPYLRAKASAVLGRSHTVKSCPCHPPNTSCDLLPQFIFLHILCLYSLQAMPRLSCVRRLSSLCLLSCAHHNLFSTSFCRFLPDFLFIPCAFPLLLPCFLPSLHMTSSYSVMALEILTTTCVGWDFLPSFIALPLSFQMYHKMWPIFLRNLARSTFFIWLIANIFCSHSSKELIEFSSTFRPTTPNQRHLAH